MLNEPGGGDGNGAATPADLSKIRESVDNMIGSMNADGAVQFDLTETEWDAVFTNNRALHGWSCVNWLLVKARRHGEPSPPPLRFYEMSTRLKPRW